MKPYYEHGGITIYHGRCEDILPNLPCSDLVCADPPYGIGESGEKNRSRIRPTKDWSAPCARDYGDFDWDNSPLEAGILELILRSAKWQIVWGGNYYNLPPSTCWLVWDKETTGDFADCELAWTNLDKAVRRIKHLWSGYKKALPEIRLHPTQKPLRVIKWAIAQAPTECKTMIDPLMGSGTALQAAKELGISAIGIDKNEQYCEIAAKRLSQEVFQF